MLQPTLLLSKHLFLCNMSYTCDTAMHQSKRVAEFVLENPMKRNLQEYDTPRAHLPWEHTNLTLSRSLRATAAATFGVVTTIKKLNKKLQKLNKAPLSPTAARGADPSRPTSAVA